MATLLKQSTAETIEFGPFLDKTDGNTEETGLALVTADILVSKNHAALTAKSDATNPTGGTNGHYQVTLDTTDTGTLGRLRVWCHKTGALAVWEDFEVVPANVYDAWVAGTDKLQADVTQLGGSTQSATDLKDFADEGYDPATNKVEGVKVVDTTTTNDDMRGTDSAALESVCTEARLAELAAANLPADIDTLLTRLSAARAALLDKLNITGNVSSQAEVLAIQNNTRTTIGIPVVQERPDSASTGIKIYLNNYDTAGNPEAPDSAPTVAVANEQGADRTGNLQHPTTHAAQTTMVNLATGRYWIEYDLDNADALENLTFTFTVIEGGVTRIFDRVMLVVDTTAVDFTAADRGKLDAVKTQTDLLAFVGADVKATLDGETVTASSVTDKAGYSISGTKTTLDALDDITAAQVKAQMVAALTTDTYDEPGQITPLATASLEAKISMLHKLGINQKATDSNTDKFELSNAAGTQVDQKSTVTDAAGIGKSTQLVAGP